MTETNVSRETPEEDGISRPLPVVEVRQPSVDRGARDAREHLDGKRCIFCGVLVGDDEEFIPTDKFGRLVTRPICKNHTEHPESFRLYSDPPPESYVFCPGCGDPAPLRYSYREQCAKCDPIEYPNP